MRGVGIEPHTLLGFRSIKAQRNKFILIAYLCSFSQNENIFAGWDPSSWIWISQFPKSPSTLIRFQTKTELFCSECGYRSSTLQRRKRSPKTEAFENAIQSGAIWKRCFWKRCFLVWTEKTMLSENGDVIKIDTTGRQTTRPWVSKMAVRLYHVASISRQFRGPMYWNAHASSSFEHALRV